ncbi:MAG: PLD nuclease N-terminal domain-containing protein, partial [Aeromicrobium sp.]
WIFCLIDVITTDEGQVRNLQKGLWILIVFLFFDIGAIVWLIAGRPQSGSRPSGLAYRGNTGASYPEYERPSRFSATNPEDDAEFLRKCRERAEEQRRAYREKKDGEADKP